MIDALATHYAHALADAVFSPNAEIKPEETVAQLRSIESLITGSKELQLVLLSPAVSTQRKQAVISALAGELGIHRLVRNFVLVVVAHRRSRELAAIRSEFERIVDEKLGWISADIASAHELSAQQKEEIERALGTKLGKYIRAHYKVEPDLLAGVRARVASREYDATLRGKLERMRQELAVSH